MARTVPVIAAEVPGNFQTAALWTSQVSSIMQWLVGTGTNGLPAFSGYQATAQAVTTSVWTSFTIDTEIIDSDNGHSTVTNTSRYTPTVPGTYLVIGTSGWLGNATGVRRVRLTLNGAVVNGTAVSGEGGSGLVMGHCTVGLITCNGSTDYIEVQGFQASGAALNTDNNTDFTPSLRALWIRA